jgi:excinuclease UvrABC ATPase subunit
MSKSKKHCLFIFHDWNEWEVIEDRTWNHYRNSESESIYKTTRRIAQMKECKNCKIRKFKTTEFEV